MGYPLLLSRPRKRSLPQQRTAAILCGAHWKAGPLATWGGERVGYIILVMAIGRGGGRPWGHVLLSAASMLNKASSYQHCQRNIRGIVGKYMNNYKQNVNIITIIVNAAPVIAISVDKSLHFQPTAWVHLLNSTYWLYYTIPSAP